MEDFPIVRKKKVKRHLEFLIISDGVGGAV